MYELPVNNACNYYEIVIMDKNKYDIGYERFFGTLAKMAFTDYKYFEKQYKQYIVLGDDNIFCHNYENEELKIFKNTPVLVEEGDGFKTYGYSKTKLTVLNYPSTTHIFDISYVKRLTFRVSNRVYINFEISFSPDDEKKTYRVYVNYNHDNNVDMKIVNKSLNEVLKALFR